MSIKMGESAVGPDLKRNSDFNNTELFIDEIKEITGNRIVE